MISQLNYRKLMKSSVPVSAALKYLSLLGFPMTALLIVSLQKAITPAMVLCALMLPPRIIILELSVLLGSVELVGMIGKMQFLIVRS